MKLTATELHGYPPPRIKALLGIARSYPPFPLDERQVDILRLELGLPVLPRLAPIEVLGKLPLHPHQKTGKEWLRAKRGRGMLAMEMRTGKTRTASEYLAEEGLLARTLVLAPLSVLPVWRSELARWLEVPCSLVRGSEAEKLAALRAPGPWITNYESMRSFEVLKAILALKPRALVLDESTRIKDRTTQTTRAVHGLAGYVTGPVIPLSGKPMPEGPLDVWSQLRCFEKDPLGFKTWYAMRNRYAILGGYLGREIVGYQDEADFAKRFREVAYRVRRADVFDCALPERQRIEVELSPREIKAYKAMQEDCLVELKGKELTAANVLAQLIRLQQITSGWAGEAKLRALADLLDDAPRPVVVWGRFTEDLKRVLALGKKRKETWGLLDGSVTGRARDQVLVDFAAGRLAGLAANPQAAGMGIDLSQAELQVYYSCGWSHEQRAQSEARPEGPSRRVPAPIVDLEARVSGKKTVDSLILDALSLKSQLSSIVMGDLSVAFGAG